MSSEASFGSDNEEQLSRAEKIIIQHLMNINEPAYPSRIAANLKGKITKPWTIKNCKELAKKGILKTVKRKPPRTGYKTEWYYLPEDHNTFYKIIGSILSDADDEEGFTFIESPYAQKAINTDFIKWALLRTCFTHTKVIFFNEFSTKDQQLFKQQLMEKYNKEGKKVVFNTDPITIDEYENLMLDTLNDYQKSSQNDEVTIYLHPLHYCIDYPFLSDQVNLENRRKYFFWENPNLEWMKEPFRFDFINDEYENKKSPYNEFIKKVLILVQISPKALYDLCYTINDSSKIVSGKDTPRKILWYFQMEDTKHSIFPMLIVDALYDLCRIPNIPPDSIAKDLFILIDKDNPQSKEILKAILVDGTELSYSFGFQLSKDGFHRYLEEKE